MLLIERFRLWRHNCSVTKRTRILHTMEVSSLERTKLGLELLLDMHLELRGSIQLTVGSLYDINTLLTFYDKQCVSIVELGGRTEVLTPELKRLWNDENNIVWLDKLFMFKYRAVTDGIHNAITLISSIKSNRDKLSSGKRQAIDARLRAVLKPLDLIVEHYIQRS